MGCSYNPYEGVNDGHGCPYMGYGSGGSQTTRYADRVCFAGSGTFPATNVQGCLDDYPVLAIDTWSGSPMGGLMGYAPTCDGQPSCTPFVQELAHQNHISHPVIGFNLGQSSHWLKSMTASAMIGGVDRAYIVSSTTQ